MKNVALEGGSNGVHWETRPKMGRLEGKNIIVTGAAGYVKTEMKLVFIVPLPLQGFCFHTMVLSHRVPSAKD
jgi:hypothetical protein